MIKKTISFTDYNDEPQVEDHYFHFNKGELILMEASEHGGMSGYLTRIGREKDPKKLVEMFKFIIEKSYGQRSPDGAKFVKSHEIFKDFESSEAYSELVVELATQAAAASEFINGLMPASLLQEVEKEAEKRGLTPSELARQESEARLRGHQAPRPRETSTVQTVPDLPTQDERIEDQVVVNQSDVVATSDAPDFSAMSTDEIRAWAQAQAEKSRPQE